MVWRSTGNLHDLTTGHNANGMGAFWHLLVLIKCLVAWPNGKASGYEPEDCVFDPHRDLETILFCFVLLNFPFALFW